MHRPQQGHIVESPRAIEVSVELHVTFQIQAEKRSLRRRAVPYGGASTDRAGVTVGRRIVPIIQERSNDRAAPINNTRRKPKQDLCSKVRRRAAAAAAAAAVATNAVLFFVPLSCGMEDVLRVGRGGKTSRSRPRAVHSFKPCVASGTVW